MTNSSFLRNSALLALSLALLPISGCSDLSKAVGLTHNPPDEFAVIDRPSLAIPPDFTLRPPLPGEPRPQSKNLSDPIYSRGATTTPHQGVDKLTNSNVSPAEQALLQNAKVKDADPLVRQHLDRDEAKQVVGDKHLVDELLSWGGKDNKPPATVVDAPAEAERLKENKDAGKPATDGATPVLDKKKHWLE